MQYHRKYYWHWNWKQVNLRISCFSSEIPFIKRNSFSSVSAHTVRMSVYVCPLFYNCFFIIFCAIFVKITLLHTMRYTTCYSFSSIFYKVGSKQCHSVPIAMACTAQMNTIDNFWNRFYLYIRVDAFGEFVSLQFVVEHIK